ncbi:glycosyltransferase family 8 protein [Gonapodya prolifera JEL478]|uniref:Glycosyltransferase family 8 protein n=1 Tax=Gonapodya prolifera (strain JEL478) TaxID=1344416 RepID=A0A139AKW3_GONPJ|nr:glycosyltransferase family 8 protein [Gonapodya prolifera JEL478]|eukprot:KXS17417.1 glycosyltransferase family 8 protein [Gonapodya prolifera JEL478]
MAEKSDRESARVVDSPKVWTTLITNTKYLSGLLTLDYSLKKVGSKYPLIALYTDGFPPEGHAALDARGIAKKKIEYLLPKAHKDYSNEVRFYDCWSKLQPFSLVEYDRVVQLDSDMVILQNMDELMDIPLNDTDRVFAGSHACVCNPLKKAHYPKDWVPHNCSFTSQHGDPDKAQMEGAPCNTGLSMVNGGLQVVNPSMKSYNAIMATLGEPSKTSSYEFADQALLSDVFKDRWVGIPYIYNALKTLRWCHAPIWRDDKVKCVHYILSPKPWDNRDSDDFTHTWWWAVNDERLAKEKEAGVVDGF